MSTPSKKFVIMRRGSFLSRLIVVNGNHPIAYDDPLGNARAYQLGDRIITFGVAPFKNHRTTHKTSATGTRATLPQHETSWDDIRKTTEDHVLISFADGWAANVIGDAARVASKDILPSSALGPLGIVSTYGAIAGTVEDVVTYQNDPSAVAKAVFVDVASFSLSTALTYVATGLLAAAIPGGIFLLAASFTVSLAIGVASDLATQDIKKGWIGY